MPKEKLITKCPECGNHDLYCLSDLFTFKGLSEKKSQEFYCASALCDCRFRWYPYTGKITLKEKKRN